MEFKSLIRPGKGAADITPLLRDGECFHRLVEALAGLFDGVAVERVACVEGRGFLLGSAVAYRLRVGLVPVRHVGRLKAAGPVHSVWFSDYSRSEKGLEIHADALALGDRVLIIDDWVETAATVRAAVQLIEQCGGTVVGIGALTDDTDPHVREQLRRYNYRFLEQTAADDQF